MILVRSFPAGDIPAGKNYIVDDAVRIYTPGYDYNQLRDFNDDVIHLDWDQAVGREGLLAFADETRKRPAEVLVAPCRLYPVSYSTHQVETVWNCTVGRSKAEFRRVWTGEPACDCFGFGMVYLPRQMIADCMDTLGGYPLRDTSFADWHFDNYGKARLFWLANPVHVHYRISEVI